MGPVRTCPLQLWRTADLRIQTYIYGTAVELNMETSPRNIRGYTDFFTVCSVESIVVCCYARLPLPLPLQKWLVGDTNRVHRWPIGLVERPLDIEVSCEMGRIFPDE